MTQSVEFIILYIAFLVAAYAIIRTIIFATDNIGFTDFYDTKSSNTTTVPPDTPVTGSGQS